MKEDVDFHHPVVKVVTQSIPSSCAVPLVSSTSSTSPTVATSGGGQLMNPADSESVGTPQDLYEYLQVQQQQQINAIIESLSNLQALQRRSPTAATPDPSTAYDPSLILNAILSGDLSKLSTNR